MAIDGELLRKKSDTVKATEPVVEEKPKGRVFSTSEIQFHLNKLYADIDAAADMGLYEIDYPMADCDPQLAETVAFQFKKESPSLFVVIHYGRPAVLVSWRKSQEV